MSADKVSLSTTTLERLTRLEKATLAHLQAQQTARGSGPVPIEKAAQKVRGAAVWWVGAIVFVLVTLAFAAGGLYVVLHRDLTVLLAIVLAVATGLPLLVALFCANQASGEATKAFLGLVGQAVRIGRKAKAP